MNRHLKCFISAPYDTDLAIVKSVLEDNKVEVFDLYDLSIGNSIQEILKRKLRQADFAIFVLSKNNKNVFYEIGVCEGLGKQYLIIRDKDADNSFYLENKLSLNSNLKDKEFLKISLQGFLEEIRKGKKAPTRIKIVGEKKVETYNQGIKKNLRSLLSQTKKLREGGQGKEKDLQDREEGKNKDLQDRDEQKQKYLQGRELEYIVEEIFKTLSLKYIQNVGGQDLGIDFALWNNALGRIIGNPLIVEIKYGRLNNNTFLDAERQIQIYAEKSEAKVALLLYLDRSENRFRVTPSLRPLIIAYDVEDFINALLQSSFENIILSVRNKIAHGLE